MAMMESAETQIAGLWGLSSPTQQAPMSTPDRQRESATKAKPAKYRRQDKGGGKGQQNGRKRPEPTEEDDAEPLVTVTQSEIRTIRALLIRHDQALNQLAVDRTYVLFFSTTEMAALDMLRTVTNHWRDQYEKGTCTTTLRAALLTSLWMEMEARLGKFKQDPAAIKIMKEGGLFQEAPNRWAYTMWSQQEKKALGGAQGSAQDPQGGSHDGGGHPSLCADAEARAERDGADRSIHPGAHHESQGRTSARRDGQAGELSSAVTDRTTPAGGKAAAEPVGQGAGKVTGLGSTGSPHCRRPTTPQAGNACQTMSMDGGAGAQSQWKQDAITHRLRYPHGRDTEKQRGDERGVASHQGSSALDGADIVGDGDLYRGATHTMSSDSNGAQRAKTADRVTDAAASTSSRKDGTQSQTTIPWQVRHPGVVASSVPPNYCLRNRSNYCYLNAVAVAVHWAVISSGSTPRDLGSFGPAIDVLNRLKQVELPGHATWKALLQGWRRPTQQHDVTELMSFVMDPRSRLVVGEWQARCIEPGHDTICDRGLTSPFISFAIRGHTTLQDALTAWHEQHYRHALCAPPKLLAIQLGRFCSVGRRTVKVRTPCVIPLEIAIPCFCDDLLECGPQLYRLCSGIVHIGDMATTGHYRPFCVHRVVHRPGYEATSPVGSGAMLGSYTLYDDDRPPVLNTAATDNLLRHNAYVVFYIRI